jgi:hypothetical protein
MRAPGEAKGCLKFWVPARRCVPRLHEPSESSSNFNPLGLLSLKQFQPLRRRFEQITLRATMRGHTSCLTTRLAHVTMVLEVSKYSTFQAFRERKRAARAGVHSPGERRAWGALGFPVSIPPASRECPGGRTMRQVPCCSVSTPPSMRANRVGPRRRGARIRARSLNGPGARSRAEVVALNGGNNEPND